MLYGWRGAFRGHKHKGTSGSDAIFPRNSLANLLSGTCPSQPICPGREGDLCPREDGEILDILESKSWVLVQGLPLIRQGISAKPGKDRECLPRSAEGRSVPWTCSRDVCWYCFPCSRLNTRYGLSADKCFSNILNEKFKKSDPSKLISLLGSQINFGFNPN